MRQVARAVLLSLVIALVFTAMVMARGQSDSAEGADETRKVAFVPSVIGNPFFALEAEGFEEAFADKGIELIYVGPESGTPEETIEIINNLVIQGVSAINFVPTDPEAINTVSRQAMSEGVVMVENGSPNMKGNVDLSTIIFKPDDVGRLLIETAAEQMDYSGQFAILSAAATSTAQNEWIAGMRKAFDDPQYSDMELVAVAYGDDIRQKSYNEAVGLLSAYPDLKCIIAPTTVGIAAAARAVTDQGLIGDVVVTGLGLPSEMAEYIENGASPVASLWNPVDLGYFNAMVTMHLMDGTITGKVGEKFSAGRLGEYIIEEEGVAIFQQIFHFDKSNIDEWKDKL